MAKASNFYVDDDMTEGTWHTLQDAHRRLQQRALQSAAKSDGRKKKGHTPLVKQSIANEEHII